ncbi:IS4 family transposase [Desulfobacula toluolica]|uniref:Transposase, IS4 family protein n=1 Tax=Desulfobacula toluolica (strain DSM 7467 / Tol2) TaxID=651182 RepID=K0NC97_DESTT|nr:transposase, IS4 family protein [Desulfobacula toluolica Tol2]
MIKDFVPKIKFQSMTFDKFIAPLLKLLPFAPELLSRGDRPLKMTFEDQIKALVYFHLQEHKSARHLIQDMKENAFAKQNIAPDDGISRSSFSEAVNHRGLEQLQFIFENLYKQAANVLPKEHKDLGDLISIDGSLIDAVLSMYWADYRKGSKKAKAHCGFNINSGIPSKVFLTEGNGGERPFIDQILAEGQTGVMDRGYQSHREFDLLQDANKHFVCRIKAKTTRTIIEKRPIAPDNYIFYDAVVLLGTPGQNQTKKPVRLVGYKIAGSKYYVATDRQDLTAEQIATIYKLRWTIESFFKWWKEHLKVYHLIARSEYGLMVQILGGLITYLLMAIYCHKEFNEKISIKRVRQLRTKILNELFQGQDNSGPTEDNNFKEQTKSFNAKT